MRWLIRRLRTASDAVDVIADGSPTLEGGASAPLPPVNLVQLTVDPTAREAVEASLASRELLGTPRPLAARESWVTEWLQEADTCSVGAATVGQPMRAQTVERLLH